jgi:hypothetical protein
MSWCCSPLRVVTSSAARKDDDQLAAPSEIFDNEPAMIVPAAETPA